MGMWESDAARVLAHLESKRDAYVAAGRDTLEVAWAIQNARIVWQAARSARVRGASATWLAAPHDFRSIGATAVDSGFFPMRLTSAFDVLIYFDHTKAAAAFNRRGRP